MRENAVPELRLQLAGEVLKVLDAQCPQERHNDKVESLILALIALTSLPYVMEVYGLKAR